MKASIKWLKEFVDFSLTPDETAHALTMAGLEVENIDKSENDALLEIDVTPNRPDCLSIKGIARELSAILRRPFKDSPVSPGEHNGEGPRIEIKDPDLCPRYASCILYGVEVGPSPEWISERLEAHGVRPENNIVDITNYVLLEMGHPLHAFDLDKLKGNCIVVKTAGTEKKFITLDNDEKKLNSDMLLIWDSQKPVAIAGVMGGLNSKISGSTVNILLESAYFDPPSIRRTSNVFNLTTEASYRFERGADIHGVVSALNRTIELITEVAGGKTTKITDLYPKPYTAPQISVGLNKIKDILRIDLDMSEVQTLLTGLGIENKTEKETSKLNKESITVTPPGFRRDIQSDMDVIEEIARLYGYDKIPSTLPAVTMQPVYKNTRWDLMNTIKDSMRKSGYSEVINYSFLNPLVLDKLRLSREDIRRNFITIRNPLRKEEEALRTTLIPALLENVRLNVNRGEKSLKIFEISSVFFRSGKKKHDEAVKIAALYLKDRGPLLWQGKHDGFYDIKGMFENLLDELRIRDYSFHHEPSMNEPYLHPGKSCVIKIDNQIIGVLGILHPDVIENFNVAADINVMELDVEKLFMLIPLEITYLPIPKYPYIERDIAIILSDNISTATAETVIRSVQSEMIESVKLFDIYEGKSIPKGKKSLAFSIRYRAGDRTLTDSEVNQLHAHILRVLEEKLQAELRS